MFVLRNSIVDDVVADKSLRRDLGAALDFTEEWIIRRARQNKPNGPLTTYAALLVLENHYGETMNQLLVDTKAQASEKNSAAVSTV